MEARNDELSYECFLCGKCTEACPQGIDGRELMLDIRKSLIKANKVKLKRFRSIVGEKKNYIFKNYSGGRSQIALFPGCNFPSFFPKATVQIANIFKEKLGAGIIFDCCGKPISELGMEAEEKRIIDNINTRLKALGVKELITMCPNCYYFLRDKLDVEVKDIYSKLRECGIEAELPSGEYDVFMPCPDRNEKKLLTAIKSLSGESVQFKLVEDVQCCGLGGLAKCTETASADLLMQRLKDKGLEDIYTYCATCCGNFGRSGIHNPKHLLLEMLNIKEQMPKGAASLFNRAAFKFKRL
jgi:Fe-S oxidoreductase